MLGVILNTKGTLSYAKSVRDAAARRGRRGHGGRRTSRLQRHPARATDHRAHLQQTGTLVTHTYITEHNLLCTLVYYVCHGQTIFSNK